MGYMKVIVLLNDAQHAVDEDPAGWWQECKQAFWKLWSKPRDNMTYVAQPETFGFKGNCNHWQAVWENHASASAVIIVGGNHSTVLGCSGDLDHTSEEGQIQILKDVLERKGYTIRRAKSRNKA